MEKIWGLFVFLSTNQYQSVSKNLTLEDDFWDYILDEAEKAKINTIILDVGDGVVFDSHPEISLPDAWTRERVHKEIEKCRAKGIKIIPKLNFSHYHSYWMHDYRGSVSTKKYYQVCSDLIKELYEIFEGPEYIHLGMDEEEYLPVKRSTELLIHDTKFLVDEVNKTGAKACIWCDILIQSNAEFTEAIKPDEVIIFPWYYDSYKKENYKTIEASWGPNDKFIRRGYKYNEETPHAILFRELPAAMQYAGYKYVPTMSVNLTGNPDVNTDETMEFYKANIHDENQVLGYVTAPWYVTNWSSKEHFDKSLDLFVKARKKHYNI